MKLPAPVRRLALLASSGLLFSVLPAAEAVATDVPPRGPNPAPGSRRGGPDAGLGMERRMQPGPRRDWSEVERTTFLGVDVTLVQPALGAQLGLPRGTGLVVERLAPRGPVAGVLKEHDVLTHLDDQILIDVRQLMVLVRNRKEGDEVMLTYLRGGTKAAAKVKLIAQDMPKYPLGGMPVPMPPRAFPRGGPGGPRSQPGPVEPAPEGSVAPDYPRPENPGQPVQPKSL
jgi:hypothetical protein